MARQVKSVPVQDPFGSFNWMEWFKSLRTESLVTSGLYRGTGVPDNLLGQDGDYYFRTDAGVGTHIYFKAAGVWAAIV